MYQIIQITKVAKNLNTEKNMIKQTKSNIKNINKIITNMQNSFICIFRIFDTTLATVIQSITTVIQAQTL